MSYKFGILLAVLLLAVPISVAQVDAAAGIQMFSTRENNVDLATSSITVNFPIRSKAGKIPVSFALVGNYHVYGETVLSSHFLNIATALQPQLQVHDYGYSIKYTNQQITECNGVQNDHLFYDYVIIDQSGASHPLPTTIKTDNDGCFTWPTTPQTTTDGSGLTATNAGTIYDKSGVEYATGGTLTDPDNATVSSSVSGNVTTYTDSLGTTFLTATSGGGGGASDTYTYKDASGNNQTFTVAYSEYTLRSNFGCATLGYAYPDYNDSSAPTYLPSTITDPNGAVTTLAYETTPGVSGAPYGTYTTGRIASITFGSGGSISYAYGQNGDSQGNNGMDCASFVVPKLTVTVNDDNGNSGNYIYVNSDTGTFNFTVTKTDPGSNKTLYNFAGEYQAQAVYYQGTSTVLKTVTTCYGVGGASPPSRTSCPTPSTTPSLPITETDVYTSLGTSSYNELQTKFDATYGNVTYTAAYDFGASTPTTQVFNVYGESFSSPTACTAYPSGSYINNTPCYTHTENSANTDVAKTQIAHNSTGHPTSVLRWISGSAWFTAVRASYNTNGTLAWSQDANENQTTFAYNGTGGCNSLLPTSITYPMSSVGSSSQTWYCNGGVLKKSADVNGNVTTYTYNDPLWRVTNVAYADGGHQATGYTTGASLPWKIETVVGLDSARNITLWRTLDGLGRTVQTANDSDPGGVNYVNTVYNNLGQVYSVTNPFYTNTDPTYGLAYYTYDALGRTTQYQHPSGITETFTFTNRAMKHVLYPSNNAFTKIYQSNGLGELTDVCEVTSVTQANGQAPASCGLDISGIGFHATNTYDALGNILSMGYGSVRSFVYDGLSRPTSATYPESGTTSYTYTSLGQLYQRVAPAPNQTGSSTVTTTYAYDAMHRLTSITYSDGTTPTVGYNYDQSSVWSQTLTNPKGRMTSATSGAGLVNAVFGYDSMGRVALHGQCTPLNCGTTNFFANYSYNYIGEPSGGSDYLGITWTNTYNAIGQLDEVTTNWLSPTQSGTIVTGITYNALGEILGDSLGDGKTEAWSYNNADGHQTAFSGGAAPGYNNTTAWLGDIITSSTDNVNSNWTYTYDDFTRLSSAVQSGGQTFNYSYDPQANRWGTISGSNQFTFNDTTNHISNAGVTYDSAGNVTYDGFHSYSYDAEGRLKQVDSGNTAIYNYDSFGHRSMQYAPPVYNEYVVDLTGRAITAVAPGTSTVYTAEVFAGGRHWVTDNGSALFLGADWLGTSRALTNLSGTFDQLYTSLPWGDSLSFAGNGSSFHTTSQYTGKEYDPEANLYHFPARQYAPVQGRWLTPDPAGLAAMDVTNPQTWNRYAYVTNNPVSMTDPLGLFVMGGGGGDDGGGDDSGSPNPFLGANLCFPGECLSNIMSLLNTLPRFNLNRLGGLAFPGAAEGPAVNTFPNGTNLAAVGSSTVIPGGLLPNGDIAVGLNIWNCPGCAEIWRNANQISDPRTIGAWYGGSLVESFAFVPSAAEGLGSGAYSAWLDFETAFPGATADIIQQLTPPPSIPSTGLGFAVDAIQQGYEWYQGQQ